MSNLTRFNEFESFSDINLFYPLANKTVSIFKNLGLTPNMITTLSLICVINSVIKINVNKREAIISYFLGYLLDCSDGIMARKYNMGSNFGMAYDLVSDGISNILIVYLLMTKNNIPTKVKVMIVVATLFLLSFNGLNEALCCHKDNCHDNFYKFKKDKLKNDKSFIIDLYLKIEKSNYKMYKKIMPKYDEKKIKSYIKFLKLFGPGNYTLFIIFLMNKYF